MGNINPNCRWPNCSCKTEQDEPCKYENPDFYINKARKETRKSYDPTYDEDEILNEALKEC